MENQAMVKLAMAANVTTFACGILNIGSQVFGNWNHCSWLY